MVGTIDYVAPEQIRGDLVDGRADVYSLACVLFECLTGHVPFAREREVATLWAHLDENPPKVTAERADAPAGIDHVVARAMAKDPGDRYPTAGALTDELRSELHVIDKRPRRRAFRTSKQRRRRRWVALVAGAAAVVAGLGVLVLLDPLPEGEIDLVTIPPNAVGQLDPATGDILQAIDTGTAPSEVVVGSGDAWIALTTAGIVSQLNAENGSSRDVAASGSATAWRWTNRPGS
jgi:serine/threonine protein kinase